ncbi:MAG: hypothetical protein IMF09_01045 [Proteobacteria bacterium]|nr:hypothetical protein [Pseudomonadota bacterium]
MKKISGLIAGIALLTCGAAQADPASYVEWNAAGQPTLSSMPGAITNALPGGLTSYPDLPSFLAVAGSPAFEDFENGMVAPGGVTGCPPPLNSLSNNACFIPGGLIAGFSVNATGGSNVVILGAGLIGPNQTSIVTGADQFAESTIITFDGTSVTAVAFDVYTNATGPITITVLDSVGGTIGVLNTGAVVPATPLFIGFTSSVPIASINIADDTGGGELLDDLRFGSMAFGSSVPIPALSKTGLLVLLLLLTGMAWRFRKVGTL